MPLQARCAADELVVLVGRAVVEVHADSGHGLSDHPLVRGLEDLRTGWWPMLDLYVTLRRDRVEALGPVGAIDCDRPKYELVRGHRNAEPNSPAEPKCFLGGQEIGAAAADANEEISKTESEVLEPSD